MYLVRVVRSALRILSQSYSCLLYSDSLCIRFRIRFCCRFYFLGSGNWSPYLGFWSRNSLTFVPHFRSCSYLDRFASGSVLVCAFVCCSRSRCYCSTVLHVTLLLMVRCWLGSGFRSSSVGLGSASGLLSFVVWLVRLLLWYVGSGLRCCFRVRVLLLSSTGSCRYSSVLVVSVSHSLLLLVSVSLSLLGLVSRSSLPLLLSRNGTMVGSWLSVSVLVLRVCLLLCV